jgi:protein-S-isoprenylcysteine O-methyltransferase Ste14
MKKAFSPGVQLVLLAVVVLGVGAPHLVHWTRPESFLGALVLILYVSWPLLESAAIARETNLDPADQDSGTYVVYAVARVLSVVVAVAYAPNIAPPPWVPVLGVLLLASGMALRTIAIRTLGVQYSNRVRWGVTNSVVSTGPYRVVRHPSYAGMLLGHLGLAVGLGSIAGIAAVVVIFVPAIVRRILVEENVLSASAEWSAFAASRPRLVPWLW